MNKYPNIKTKYNILMNKKYIDIDFYTNTKIIGWTYWAISKTTPSIIVINEESK